MATIKQLPSGYWRLQISRRGNYASKTFRIKAAADRWPMSRKTVWSAAKAYPSATESHSPYRRVNDVPSACA
jgi:hypothetical protein